MFSQPPPLRINLISIASLAVPLLEVEDRRARPQVVARVLAGDRIHRVRPQLASTRRLRDRVANHLLHRDLVNADGRLDLEGRHAGVLADCALAVGGEIDVLRDDRERLRRLRAGRFRRAGLAHRHAHVWRQIGRGFHDEIEDRVEQGG